MLFHVSDKLRQYDRKRNDNTIMTKYSSKRQPVKPVKK